MSKLRHRESWYSRTKKELEEMDYKEKYRIAFDKAKEIYEGQLGTATRVFLEQIFPELKESEDERIIKFLKHAATLDAADELFQEYGVKHTQVIAWLDKQKERRAYWELYKGVSESEWFKENYKGKSLGEEQPAEWTEEDEKMWVDIKGQMIYGSFIPFDKILWLESRLKSLRPQPKQEWSEEDETRLTNILIMLKEYVIHHYSKDDVNKSVDWLENRVKSLRPTHWKPSQEQMEALQRAVNKLAQSDVSDSVRLSIMYDNLKKL